MYRAPPPAKTTNLPDEPCEVLSKDALMRIGTNAVEANMAVTRALAQ